MKEIPEQMFAYSLVILRFFHSSILRGGYMDIYGYDDSPEHCYVYSIY